MKTLVIGYGNTLRGDDGVGPRVAEQLEALVGEQMRLLSVHQLTPELAAEMVQAEVVWFVDAWVGGVKPTVQTLTMASAVPAMDHDWRPETLLHMAKTLYDAEPTAYHLLIPAQQFDYGETLSAMALSGVEWAVQTIKAVVEEKGVCHA
ncbi:MAG: hydrogenase maturation protease [Leptolyngbyaceae cyanobacterium MO_188.B28]|nr:hydrogenase maturation protease [Leptolyngbyaceae cyanobacterium MO_188.B28]